MEKRIICDKMINDYDLLTTCDISGFIKEDIRAILLYQSNVKDTDIVLDINCGVGEISAEFSKLSKEVISIDSREQSIMLTDKNIKKHGNSDKVRLVNKDEIEALNELESFDIAILKTNNDNYNEIIDLIHKKINSKGRIFILTNILDFQVGIVNKLGEFNYNPKITQINLSNGVLLNNGIKIVSDNPITIISVKKR